MITSHRKLAGCLCVLVASGMPALAAGQEAGSVDPFVTAPSADVDWTGAYAGVTFGAAFGDGEADLDDYFGMFIEPDVDEKGLFPRSIDGHETDASGGVTLGYNVQRGNLVGGIEFDFSAMNQSYDHEFSRVDPGAPPAPAEIFEGTNTNTSYRTEISDLATLRVRAGVSRERTLFYGTAGVAAGQVENEFSLALPNAPAPFDIAESWSEDGTHYGYVLGAGFERRLTDRISLKGEVIYYDLQDVTIEGRVADPPQFGGEGIDYEFQNDGYVARLGINLSF